VFKNIAEKTMVLNSNRKASHVDNDSIREKYLMPVAKSGYYKALQTVMTNLNLPLAANSTDWAKVNTNENETHVRSILVSRNVIPDLTGMGAKDAVFILENMGLNVQVQGLGKVISQDQKPGSIARKGTSVQINLQ
jgi:cell division protein FtsI (penicillin-binding protein 3)